MFLPALEMGQHMLPRFGGGPPCFLSIPGGLGFWMRRGLGVLEGCMAHGPSRVCAHLQALVDRHVKALAVVNVVLPASAWMYAALCSSSSTMLGINAEDACAYSKSCSIPMKGQGREMQHVTWSLVRGWAVFVGRGLGLGSLCRHRFIVSAARFGIDCRVNLYQ
jgi:hypothetical protein